MLSFLKDGQLKIASGETKDSTSDGQESTGSHQEKYLTVAGHEKKLKQSTTLLAILFVVGIAGVWLMIRKAVPSQASAVQKKDDIAEIETAVAQLNGMRNEVNTQMKSVSSRLNHLSEVGQVAVEDLRKNPFSRDILAAGSSLVNPAQQQFIEEQVRRKAAGLQLWSITASPRGACCMINDKVLYEGDTIDGLLVKEIKATRVILEQNGVQQELRMD